MDQFIGEIRIFAGDYAPRGWAMCDGQLLPISRHTALYSILGTMYGGDGQTTFALPNLEGRIPVGMGAGAGLTPRETGETGGESSVSLTEAQLPVHARHTSRASTGRPHSRVPMEDGVLGSSAASPVYRAGTANVKLSAETLGPVQGGGMPHNNLMPSMSLNYCIALEGEFPARG